MSRSPQAVPHLPDLPHFPEINRAGILRMKTIRQTCIDEGWSGVPDVRAWVIYISQQLANYSNWTRERKNKLAHRAAPSVLEMRIKRAAQEGDRVGAVVALVSISCPFSRFQRRT